jgi:hypothetical protein
VLNDFERTKLAQIQLRTLLVNLDVFSLELDKVTNIEDVSGFLVMLVLFLYLFFGKLKSCFGISTDLCKMIKPLV